MLVIVGAAGAYGLRESEQSLAAALIALRMDIAPVVARAAPLFERAAEIAGAGAAVAQDAIVIAVPRRGPAVMPSVDPPPSTPRLPAAGDGPVGVAAPVQDVASEPAVPVEDAPRDVPALAAAGPAPAAWPSAVAAAASADQPAAAQVPQPVDTPKAAETRQIAATPKEIEAAHRTSALTAGPSHAMEQAPAAVAPANPALASVPAAVAADAGARLETVPNTVAAPTRVSVPLPAPKPPLTPAQRLNLQGKDYAKAENCLSKAIYFEARNEPIRGQMAVAQVVLNRVFSPYYPNDICAVVYQNAHRHLSCQFTFACDGKPETIRERGAWARAQRIARQALEAKVWLPDVGKSTHYHAAYVRPYWIREMNKMVRHGLHTFYRPKHWGDGSNEPAWGAGAVKKASSS